MVIQQVGKSIEHVDPELRYPHGYTHNLRVLALTSASISITSAIAVLVWWFLGPTIYNHIHKNNPLNRKGKRLRQFRHDLTITMIVIDCLKCFVILAYPARFIHETDVLPKETYSNFCNVAGFLTVVCQFSEDITILAIAIHSALLIFKPSFTGGLYRYRYFLYSIFLIIIPFTIASMGFIGSEGFTFFPSYCFFSVYPIWKSLALAWGPRIILMCVIFIIYIAIFLYVKTNMEKVSNALYMSANSNSDKERTFGGKVRRTLKSISSLPRRIFSLQVGNSDSCDKDLPCANTREKPSNFRDSDMSQLSQALTLDLQRQINLENYERFKRRKKIIQRQVRSIFIYPICYVLVMIFPFIQQVFHYASYSDNPRSYGFWLVSGYLSAWTRPFTCFVNCLIFFLRESGMLHDVNKHHEHLERPSVVAPELYCEEYTDVDATDLEMDYIIDNKEGRTDRIDSISVPWVKNTWDKVAHSERKYSLNNLFQHSRTPSQLVHEAIVEDSERAELERLGKNISTGQEREVRSVTPTTPARAVIAPTSISIADWTDIPLNDKPSSNRRVVSMPSATQSPFNRTFSRKTTAPKSVVFDSKHDDEDIKDLESGKELGLAEFLARY